MQIETPASASADHETTIEDELSDFSTNPRVLLLSAMAIVIGAISSLVAYVLIWLIAAITNLAFYHRFSAAPVVPQGHHLGYWVILVPVAGAIIIGFMARFGSEKIRGHGIPEALEAILLGRSRISPTVAILKPLSSAISIGTGGPFGAEESDHHDRWRIWFDLCAAISYERGGAENFARRRRGGGDGCRVRDAGGGSVAGGGIASV